MRSLSAKAIIAVSLPFILWYVCGIQPTFDDFTTLQSPQFTPLLSSGLLPNDSFWRPWDYLFGCLLGRFTWLFPAFNHVMVILGHTLSAWLVFRICKWSGFKDLSANMATLLFFFSPASLGATLACDGLNQTYALMWGLVSLLLYLKSTERSGAKILYAAWAVTVIISALSKENGLAWAVIPPIFAYVFHRTDRRKLCRDTGMGLMVAVAYFAARTMLSAGGDINQEYLGQSVMKHAIDLCQIIVYNWVPIDYMSVVYAPERCWPLAVLTSLTVMPFLIFVMVKAVALRTSVTLWGLILCFFISVAPHLVTLASIMHNYAALCMTAFITGYLADHTAAVQRKRMLVCFGLYMATAVVSDIHHAVGARQSGELGRNWAFRVIEQSKTPVQNVLCITIEDDHTPKYSSFGVRPVDAFGWGLSVTHYTHYEWPSRVESVIIREDEADKAEKMAREALHNGYDAAWIISNQDCRMVQRDERP